MKNKLLIFSVFKSLSWLRKVGYKKIIQNRKFEYGLRIKNINNKPFEGGLIKNAVMYPSGISEENTIVIQFNKEFKIHSLNPNESYVIWLDKLAIPFSGGCWIKLDIESKETTTTYQWDTTNKTPEVVEDDKFTQLFYIENEHNFLQKITNILLIILTFVLVVKELFFR